MLNRSIWIKDWKTCVVSISFTKPFNVQIFLTRYIYLTWPQFYRENLGIIYCGGKVINDQTAQTIRFKNTCSGPPFTNMV